MGIFYLLGAKNTEVNENVPLSFQDPNFHIEITNFRTAMTQVFF